MALNAEKAPKVEGKEALSALEERKRLVREGFAELKEIIGRAIPHSGIGKAGKKIGLAINDILTGTQGIKATKEEREWAHDLKNLLRILQSSGSMIRRDMGASNKEFQDTIEEFGELPSLREASAKLKTY